MHVLIGLQNSLYISFMSIEVIFNLLFVTEFVFDTSYYKKELKFDIGNKLYLICISI